jgi:hypothetical protein
MAVLKAAVSVSSGEIIPRGQVPPEEQVVSMLRALRLLAAGARTGRTHATANSERSLAIHQYLLENHFADRLTPEALLKFAETLSVRATLESYEAGGLDIVAARRMLQRFGQELESLYVAVKPKLERRNSSTRAQTDFEILDARFWDTLPESMRLKVLLSSKAWCCPARQAAITIRSLLEREEMSSAQKILANYSSALRSSEAEARARAAVAFGQLAACYAQANLLETTVEQATAAVTHERDAAIRDTIIASIASLAREAESRSDFKPLRMAWTCADKASDTDAAAIRSKIVTTERIRELFTEAVASSAPAPALLDVLRSMPKASADAAVDAFTQCQTAAQRECLVHLVSTLGDATHECLRERYRSAGATAIPTIGLLTRLDHALLDRSLSGLLRSWSRSQQDAVVRQIASSGSAMRGGLLLRVLDSLDPLVASLALDEIGMSHSAVALNKLVELARGEGLAQESAFLQVKAIECVSRMEEPSIAPELMNIAVARRPFGYRFPAELRIASLQALLKLVPEVGRKLHANCGIGNPELRMAPLAPSFRDNFLRQRRFTRVTPRRAVYASAILNGVRCPISVESLSLVGGAATVPTATCLDGEAVLELGFGFRRAKAQVIMRQVRPYRVGFEFSDMALDDRYRLRQFLAN